MSRRKQARPIRHLDDIDGTEDAANLTAEDGARTSPDDEDDASEAECDEQLEKCDAKRSSDSPSSADGDNEDRVNNNENRTARGRRRKRDEDDDLDELEDASDDQDERVRRPSCGDDDVEDSGENERRARAKKPARDTDVFPSSQPTEEGESGNNGSVNPYHPSLFPYAATLANANVTLDALQNTKMAIAQFAANAMANNGQQSPQALQELAVLQSTLYALQQQQIMQLQLIQQLQQQLQINQPEGGNGTGSNGGKENINLSMFGFGLDGSAAADERERDPSLESSSRTSTPGHVTANQSRGGELNETAEPLPADISKRASELLAASSALLRKEERSGRSENKTDESDRRESKKSPSKTREEGDNNGQSKSSLFPSTSTWSSTTQSTASTSYSFSTASIMSQLPGGSLADTILQASDPPPNPEGPSTLEMLQRTAQQVLNNASQGLLATNLADELGFRTNGNGAGNGASGEGGKKDQLFKHRCRYCGKVFSSDSALQIHIRSHTGERPFKCNICGNRFTTKGNLKVHFQRHAARFPHIKMNPLPVPEHLDKFHPPLLAQLDLDESKMSPSGAPFGPISGSTSAPSNLPSRDNRAPSPTGFLRPNLSGQIPVSVSSFFGRNASASNGSAVPGGDLMPALRPMFPGLSVAGLKEAAASFLSSAAAAAVAGQDLPENLSSKQSSSAIVDNSTDKKESAKSAASSEPDTQQIKTERADQSVDDEMDFDDSAQADRESNHQAETEGENETSAADNKREEMMLSGRNSRAYSHDESSVDSNFSGHEQELADDNINNSRHEDHKDNSLDGPENLSGRRSANSSPASTVNSVSGTAGRGDLPFSPVNFGQFGPPGGPLRFPMGFPIPPMGAMGNFNPAALATHGGAVRGEQGAGNPNGNAGITLHTPVGPIVLPPDVDPAKDPAIYTNLLPRPGSNDNAWESLIEVTKTSETAKLQHLVDNIENKLVDPNQCVVCHRVLSCKSALQMHYRTHTGERPFKCKICGRAFTTKGNLKTHMGVHRAKPPARMLHMCPVCHKKFTNGLVLQQHIRLHTGEPTDMTPEQIQAAELREFPHPFPFMGGFHPFLHHGGPFSPLNSIPGMTGPSLGPDGGSEKPLSFSLKSDNGGKDGEGREDGDLQTEGSSSEALSPASSTANEMSHANRHAELLAQMSRANEALFKKYQQEFIDANDESVNRSDLISECDSEIGGKLEKDFRNEALPSPDDSKEDIEESLHQQKSSNPRHFSPARSSTPDHSLKAADVKSSNNPMASERSSSSASLLSGPLLNHRSGATESSGRSKGSKQPVTGPLPGHPPLSPLDLTAAGRGPPFFPGGYNILPPGPGALPSSVSPGSALSSLTSAVMTSPSFNPLNLPISAPGRGNTTCNICFKTFACHSALEIHYRSHTKERPFKCSICDRGFSTKGNMKQHMMTHKNRDGTPISADVLKSLERSRPNNSFRDAGNSKSNSSDDNNVNDDSHKDGHSSSASSSVSPPKEHCLSLTIQHSRDGATLPLKAISPIDASAANCNGTSSLLSANRSSSSSASFRSSAANKKRSAGLPKHLCHTCDKNFSSSSSLQIHMRTHTGDRPFQCPVCAKAFTTRGNLKVHMGTHSATSINSNGASSNIRSSSSRRGRRMSVDLLTTTNWTMMASKVPPHPAPRPASPSNPANSGACHRPSRPGYPVPFAPALHHLSAFTGLRQPGLLFPSHLVPAYLNAASASEENLAAAYREVNSMSSLSYLNGDLTKNEAATTSGSSNQRRRRENDDEDVEQPGRDSPSRIVIASTPPTSQPWMWHPMDLNKRQVERTDVEADDTDTETDRKDSPAFSTTPPRCEVIRAK